MSAASSPRWTIVYGEPVGSSAAGAIRVGQHEIEPRPDEERRDSELDESPANGPQAALDAEERRGGGSQQRLLPFEELEELEGALLAPTDGVQAVEAEPRVEPPPCSRCRIWMPKNADGRRHVVIDGGADGAARRA